MRKNNNERLILIGSELKYVRERIELIKDKEFLNSQVLSREQILEILISKLENSIDEISSVLEE